jgi:hypothetical protein
MMPFLVQCHVTRYEDDVGLVMSDYDIVLLVVGFPVSLEQLVIAVIGSRP